MADRETETLAMSKKRLTTADSKLDGAKPVSGLSTSLEPLIKDLLKNEEPDAHKFAKVKAATYLLVEAVKESTDGEHTLYERRTVSSFVKAVYQVAKMVKDTQQGASDFDEVINLLNAMKAEDVTDASSSWFSETKGITKHAKWFATRRDAGKLFDEEEEPAKKDKSKKRKRDAPGENTDGSETGWLLHEKLFKKQLAQTDLTNALLRKLINVSSTETYTPERQAQDDKVIDDATAAVDKADTEIDTAAA